MKSIVWMDKLKYLCYVRGTKHERKNNEANTLNIAKSENKIKILLINGLNKWMERSQEDFIVFNPPQKSERLS